MKRYRRTGIFYCYFRLLNVLILFFLLLVVVSCRKNSESIVPGDESLKVWLHRVNTIDKAQHFQYLYTGFELDVNFDTVSGTFLVEHDITDSSTLTLATWFSSIYWPSRLSYWLDFKNLSPENKSAALSELLRIRTKFGLNKQLIVVESFNPENLTSFDTLNFRPSFYIPAFDPSTITQDEEIYFKDYIDQKISATGIKTISAYYMQHSFMKKWFPEMNKLLWYLDSYETVVKDSIIRETKKDKNIEVLLVGENYP